MFFFGQHRLRECVCLFLKQRDVRERERETETSRHLGKTNCSKHFHQTSGLKRCNRSASMVRPNRLLQYHSQTIPGLGLKMLVPV